MTGYLIRRFVSMVITLWVIITLTFFLMHAIPGSPFNQERTSNEAVQQNLMEHYNLDEPLVVQYVSYLGSLIQLDLGPSITNSTETVNEMLARSFPVSAELGAITLFIAIVSGITLGVIAALRHNGVVDYSAMVLAVIGISVPNFIMATLLIQVIAVQFELLPVATWSSWQHIILPATALSLGPIAIIARLTRSNMLEVLSQDYIRTAKAKGLSPFTVVFKHALRNALIPIITLMGTLLAGILTGTFVIEKIFAIPGMGQYFIDSLTNRDYPVIMGTTVFYSAFLILTLFLVDIAYGIIDPRIKVHGKGD